MEDSPPTEQRRMFRFLHSSLAIISLIWIAICLLIYFYAPSYQSQQVFDCRWYLSALIIQAVFGHIFIFCSNQKSAIYSYIAAFISTQYAIVYSMLTLIIYGMDTIMLIAATKPAMLNYAPYLKLTAVLIVLSAFGLALSLVHMHRLIQFGQFLGAIPNLPALGGIRLYRALTGAQVFFALLSIYMAISLMPMKFWYVRLHMVQEFSCSLLAICLAILQFVIFRPPHGSGQFLLKPIIFANACQMMQELNMALSAFYTYFYVDRIYNVVEDRLAELSINNDPHMLLAMARGSRAKTMLAMNLVLHIGRMLANAFLLFHLANWVFADGLALRVKFKVDSALENVEQNWEKIKRKEKKWLYSIAGCVFVVGFAHLLLNFGYILASMIFESLSVATGLSFVFSIALVISIGLYTYKMCRFFLILSAYISLNLLITACLLLFSFFQEFFFLATALDDDDENEMFRLNSTSTLMDTNSTDSKSNTNITSSSIGAVDEEKEQNSALRVFLYFADFGLSLATFIIAAFTIRYAIRTLIQTKLLQTQPANVQRAIRILRVLALVGLISSVIEIFMIGELRLGSRSKITAHSSINTSFYDWLLSASQFLFLFYVCRYERFQALLPVQLLQLASVGVTTLDLIGQQTETVQIYVNNILQFYRITEALLQKSSSSSSGSDHDGNGPNTVFISQPVAYTIPLHLFVDILALHFLQIIQWFLTISSLVIALYAFDNMVEDESDRLNDFHELRGGHVHGIAGQNMGGTESTEAFSGSTNFPPIELTPPIDPGNGKMNSTTSSTMAFDNRMFTRANGGNDAKLEE